MTESKENYLETILVLSDNSSKPVKSVDIANYLGYSRASVSRALGILRREDYVKCDHSKNVYLSEKGKDVASRVYRKRQTLIRLFRECGKVDQRTAEIDACKVEHVISDITYRGIKQFLEKNYKNT